MSHRQTYFADVILPLAVPNLYTYRVPMELNDVLQRGMRVVVQFGRSKRYSGLVRNIHEKAPTHYQAKYIETLLDERPIVTAKQIEFWEWVGQYYMCYPGEVMIAALPSALKLASETRILLNQQQEIETHRLSDKEYLIYEALRAQEILSVQDVAEILDQKTVYPLIKKLIEKRVVILEEEIKEQYKPKMASYVRLTQQAEDEDNLRQFFNELEKAPKQLEVLMAFVQLSRRYSGSPMEVKKVKLQKVAGATASTVNQLVIKGIVEVYEKEIGRLNDAGEATKGSIKFSNFQQNALTEINGHFKNKEVALLHGVTGSGKTEIYIQLILDVLKKGKQALYLVPEIALTAQLVNRLRSYFGDKIGVYHSKFNQHERVEVWNRVLHKKNRYDVIIGARSAVFLPFSNLGLVVVDEEHENSYKQYDPAPRYNARDAALVLSKIHGAKTLLGSATPSIESTWHAKQEHFGLVQLDKRYGEAVLPEILCADVTEDTRKKKMSGHFSSLLKHQIELALEEGEQVILFQNRRGFTPLWKCKLCGWVPQCTRCDISLTYHKHSNRLKCHYCGYNTAPPKTCSACGSHEIDMIGFGTEKIEEELGNHFPKAKVQRMDLDTTRSKNAYSNIITAFEDRETDILVGTQMVTKGLDFDNVGLVGIMNADGMLNFPDFRAFERAYQLMAQVAGRAGRKKKRGKVVIQTWQPNHWIIRQVMENAYGKMYEQEVLERRNFSYPPFVRLIELSLRHKERERVDYASGKLATALKEQLGKRVLGPEYPGVARIKNLYHKNILIKMERQLSAAKVKEMIADKLVDFKQDKECKPVRVVVDVDPN